MSTRMADIMHKPNYELIDDSGYKHDPCLDVFTDAVEVDFQVLHMHKVFPQSVDKILNLVNIINFVYKGINCISFSHYTNEFSVDTLWVLDSTFEEYMNLDDRSQQVFIVRKELTYTKNGIKHYDTSFGADRTQFMLDKGWLL